MSNGLLYVVFGKEYDALAAHAISYSRQFTNLPICVLTNLKERNKKWKGIKNIRFRYFPLRREDNRNVKTKVIQFSPFDLTLFLDCDNVIQRKGIESVFNRMGDNDMLFSVQCSWKIGDKVLVIYKRMMKQTGVVLPLRVYHTGFYLFRKNERVYSLFNLWHKYWRLSGMGRDMPAFACAVSNSKLSIKVISAKDMLFSAECKRDAVVQHRYAKRNEFAERFGLPKWRSWKPFDGLKNRKDFTWTHF